MYTESTKKTLISHGVSPKLVQAINGKELPKPLCYDFSSPGFTANEVDKAVSGLRGLIPLFEQNGEAVIGFLPRSNLFIRFYYEDVDTAIEIMGAGYIQFASKLILESEEAGSECFDTLVDFLEFPYGSKLRELLDADPYDDQAVEDFHAALAAV